MNQIDVGITSWPKHGFPERLDYLERVVVALFEWFDTAGCDVRYTVSAESKDADKASADKLKKICEHYDMRLLWHAPPPALNRNMKSMIEYCDRPYFFYMQDDWLLDLPVHLAEDIPLLEEMDILRYRWVGKIHGLRMLNSLFEEISTRSNWFYAHNPYLAKRESLLKLFPMMASESQVNRQAKNAKLRIAVRKPRLFKHIGGQSVMTPKKKRPIEN